MQLLQSFLLMFFISYFNDLDFLELVKKIESLPDPSGFFENEKNVIKLLTVANIKEDDFKWRYLKLIKDDIDTFNRLDQTKKKEVLEDLNVFFISYNNNRNNPIPHETLRNLNEKTRKIKTIFGDCSFFDHFATCRTIANKIYSYPDQNYLLDINSEISRFISSKWKDSPMLCQLYIIKCRILIDSKKFEESYSTSLLVKNMRLKICPHESDVTHISAAAYEIQSLCGLKRYAEAIQQFKKIPEKTLETDSGKYLAGVSEIFSSVATSYFETGNVDASCIYQEMALAKMYQWSLDRSHPGVLEQAKKLQKFLAKKGDTSALRSVEDRYNLSPIPK